MGKVVPALSKTSCRFTCTLRTFAEQDVLYAQGRTKLYDAQGVRLGIITNAKGGQSLHNYGLAFDIVLLDGTNVSWDTVRDFDKDGVADWMEVVNIFKKSGYEWGGDWKFTDKPHLQKVFGYTWQELLVKYNKKDIIPGTQYVNL